MRFRHKFKNLHLIAAILALCGEGCATTQIPIPKTDMATSQPSDSEIKASLILRLMSKLSDAQKGRAEFSCGSDSSQEIGKAVLLARTDAEAKNNKKAGQIIESVDIEIKRAGNKWIVCAYGEKKVDKEDPEKDKNIWIELHFNVFKEIIKNYSVIERRFRNPDVRKKIRLSLTKKLANMMSAYPSVKSGDVKIKVSLEGKTIVARAREISQNMVQEAIKESEKLGSTLTESETRSFENMLGRILDDMERYMSRMRRKKK